ncbi:MAG: hypothetical protein ABFR62_03660 [Bacteroidota bacterium]
MINKGVTYLLYGLAITAMVALMGFANYRHNSKTVSGVEIKVLDYDSIKFINEEVVSKMVALTYDSLTYRISNSINVSLLENEVERLSSVEKADVFIDIEGRLAVNVIQRKPIGRIITSKYNCYIDERGEKMPLSQLFTLNVPLIDGKVNDENLYEIFSLLDYIRNNSVLKEQIVSIKVDKYNEYEFRTRKGNQVIEFGKATDIERKFDKLLIYYRKTVSDFGWERYKKINLEYANQVVCTKR